MPKSELPLASDEYATVAERIELFFGRFPYGRIVTELVSRTARETIFRAAVYRSDDEAEPAATGWAAEREGDGDINTVACVENTETSAVGRALANLGFLASRQRPSREEMEKANRGRRALRIPYPAAPGAPAESDLARTVSEPSRGRNGYRAHSEVRDINATLQANADLVHDLLSLIASAERRGMRAARATSYRDRLLHAAPGVSFDRESLLRVERRLRRWILSHGGSPRHPGSNDSA